MAEERGTPEVRAAYTAAMGEELATRVLEIEARIDEIEDRWALLLELYGTSAARVDVLRRAGPMAFGLLEDLLWEDVVVRLARVTNGPAIRGRRLVTLSSLPQLVGDAAFRPALAVLIGRARIAVDGARRHRESAVTPSDGIVVRAMPTALPLDQRAKVQEAIDAVRAVLQSLLKHYVKADRTPRHHLPVVTATAQLFATLQAEIQAVNAGAAAPGHDVDSSAATP